MLGLKLNHVSKRGQWLYRILSLSEKLFNKLLVRVISMILIEGAQRHYHQKFQKIKENSEVKYVIIHGTSNFTWSHTIFTRINSKVIPAYIFT